MFASRLSAFSVGEPRLVHGLLGEAAHHADARERLLQIGGDRADRLTGSPEGSGGDDPKPQRAGQQQGQHAEGDQREFDVQVEQDPDRAEQRQPRLEERDHGVGNEAFERLHVVGHARDQHSRGAALVEADRQGLQVGEDADAQICQRPLSDPADEIGLQRRSSPTPAPRRPRRRCDQARACRCRGGRFLCRSPHSPAAGRERRCRAEHQREQHRGRAQAVGAQQRRTGRAGCARGCRARSPPRSPRRRVRAGARRLRPLPAMRAHRPLTSGSRGLRVRKTWSGRPFSTISRYSSER